MKEEGIEITGKVKSHIKDIFVVTTEFGDVNCHLSGKMRKNYIKITEHDEVTIEVSPYDTKKGRIIYRQR